MSSKFVTTATVILNVVLMRYLQMYNLFEKFYVQTPELTGKLKIPGGQFPS